MTTLGEAATGLRRAREDNEERDRATANLEATHPVRREIRAERLRIAEGLLAAAAIEAGLPPCCRPPHPEPGEAP